MRSETDGLQIAAKNRGKEQRDRCECDSVLPAFKGHLSELDWEDVWATEKMQTILFTPSLHFSSQSRAVGSHALHLCNDFVFFSTGSGPDVITALKRPSSGLMLIVIGVCAIPNTYAVSISPALETKPPETPRIKTSSNNNQKLKIPCNFCLNREQIKGTCNRLSFELTFISVV